MKSWQFLTVGATCLALAACRTDPNIAILERELRLQEDKIYQLQDCLEDEHGTLEACRRENEALRKRLTNGVDKSEGPADRRSSEPTFNHGSGAGGSPAGSSLAPPTIELPSESMAPGQLPKTFQTPAQSAPLERSEPAPSENKRSSSRPHEAQRSPGAGGPTISGPILPSLGAADGETESRSAGRDVPAIKGDSKQVAKIVLARLASGGNNSGDRSTPDDVLLVVEPRDATGRLIEAPAGVSVVVLDPAAQGDAARLARWDFTAAEIASRFRQAEMVGGYELELPWPAGPPMRDDLHLFVRYTTSDGRKLEADRALKFDPPGQLPRDGTLVKRGADANAGASALQADRSAAAWRPTPTPPASARGADSLGRRSAERADEAPLRTAVAPLSAAARRAATKEPKMERPIWSPERE